jgi:hypothetical protein
MDVELRLTATNLVMTKPRVLKLGKTIFGQHSLIGRGTIAVEAKCVDGEDEWAGDLIVKFSWPAATRTPEQDTINKARDHAKLHDRSKLDHLPNVIHAQDMDRSLVSKQFTDKFGDNHERRVLRIIVQEKLSPITDLHDAPSLGKAVKDIFKCAYPILDSRGNH